MSSLDPKVLAEEMVAAYAAGQTIPVPPSGRDPGFDLTAGYAVEAELARLRRASGHAAVGRKIGFPNRALWRTLNLDTLLWAHMYDSTVQYAEGGVASFPLDHACSPKLEPEIVFKLKKPLGPGAVDAAAVLDAVEWMALGYEIIDCAYPNWKFQPADFVAAFGFHAGLVVGKPRRLEPGDIQAIAELLPVFKARLTKNGELAAEGAGSNVLENPAASLGELASALARQPGAEPLEAGEIITTGSLTAAQPIAAGQTWTISVEGLGLPDLTLKTT